MSLGEATEAVVSMRSQRLRVSDRRGNSSMMIKQGAEIRTNLKKALA